MFGNYFYWASLRKVRAVFGNLFNDIWIQRTDADGNVVKTFKVPIEPGQKEGYLVRLHEEQKKEDSPGIAITLPRLSYEFVGMSYNADDKRQTSRYLRKPGTTGTDTALKMFNPVPYIVNMDLHLYSKTFDDQLQILEQILPYFGPALGLTINEVPEFGLKNDINIQIDGLDTSTEYEGNIGVDRILQWTINFSIMTNLYHPTSNPAVIKKVIENTHARQGEFEKSPDQAFTDQIITQVVNPITADENDVYTIVKTIQEF